MNIEDNKGTTVLWRKTGRKPPRSLRTWLIGRPLSTADAPHQTIGKAVGLAVFSSDAMSSVAYAPQEMLVILAVAGVSAFHYSIPLAFAIVGLLALLTISYEQTIHAYPSGGGAYIVARDNLGELPAQVAGASLLTGYILTVSVSIASGVAQIVSAYPSLYSWRVWISVAFIFLVMLINLRGVRESGLTFAIPTYFFLVMMYITVGIGLFRWLAGTLGTVTSPPEIEIVGALQPVTLFLILKAFASGNSALTGVEAISNGIPAFKDPKSKNAGITLIIMATVLGTLLLGITTLSYHIGALPSEGETVISQLARTVFDSRGIVYLLTIVSTTVILVMAANTAFADFPRLSAIAAADGFLPRQLTYRGSRLVYSRGIAALALIASGLIIVFQASVTRLIPLYAIGVFLSFTLSQMGMAHRWWKSGRLKPGEKKVERGSTLTHDANWRLKMAVNAFGTLLTFIVTLVFAVTKFTDGAWIVIILIPLLVTIFSSIHRHYQTVANALSLEKFNDATWVKRHRVIILVGGVHRGLLAGLRYARTLSDDITAVHVSLDLEETERIQKKWEKWGEGIRFVILESPYRLFLEPLLEYIDQIDAQRRPNELVTIVVPHFVSRRYLTSLLHSRTANTLREVLLHQKEIVITEVPYEVD
ncbi:MAG: APC family permease [Anaerolineaceae bacterium]|nr:APC family permease [Anaerolineaceae bacterium]